MTSTNGKKSFFRKSRRVGAGGFGARIPRRARGGLVTSNGAVLPLGGKTGTGDNRVKVAGPGGRWIESRATNRTAAFVFMVGDRFFGTVMVFVPGRTASDYEFTSSLAVQVFQDLQPALKQMIDH